MSLLTDQNIEAELSYAYLHAVAARAGMSCEVAGRHSDNWGVDAKIMASHEFVPDAIFTDITLHVQLKATTRQPALTSDRLSYFMADTARYDRLRSGRSVPRTILAVLFLPADASEWLTFGEERLVLQRCAYWTSLVGAEASTNETGQTVYLPVHQRFSPQGLTEIMRRLSRDEELRYEL